MISTLRLFNHFMLYSENSVVFTLSGHSVAGVTQFALTRLTYFYFILKLPPGVQPVSSPRAWRRFYAQFYEHQDFVRALWPLCRD